MEDNRIIEYKGIKFEPYLSKEKINELTKNVASQISKDYMNKNPIFVGVLNGSFMWMADLVREIKFNDLSVEFCKVSSYQGEQSNGFVKELVGLKSEVKDRHIILIEDIVDSGQTMKHVIPWVQSLGPASVALASLFVKRECIKVDIKIDYWGMDIENRFILGYGLDFDEWGRNLPEVWIKKD